jgi:hypothetical protein
MKCHMCSTNYLPEEPLQLQSKNIVANFWTFFWTVALSVFLHGLRLYHTKIVSTVFLRARY